MTSDEDERAQRDALHDIENWARKRPGQDPVHLIAVRVAGLPSRRALCTWSLLARLTRDGGGPEITDLGVVNIGFDVSAFGNGTRILWLRERR